MTKETLKQYKGLRQERDRLLNLLVELETVMYGPKSQQLTGMPRGGNGHGSEVENLAIKHDDLRTKYEAKVQELSTALEEIETAIEVLEPRERTLIRLHYIQGLTWEEVCVEMCYSWKQIHRIHSKALKTLKGE